MKPHLLIQRQVPEFVRAEYPGFVDFLEAYYKWLEDSGATPPIDSVLDIDRTVDSFLQYFKQPLDKFGVLSKSDNRLYLKHIRELYSAKGSEAAIKFLFQLVYNKQAEVRLPWDDVLKASDGRWFQDTAVIVRVTRGDIDDVVGKFVHIIDANGVKYKTTIKSIIQRAGNVYELFIERFSCGVVRFVAVESYDRTFRSTILLTTGKPVVEHGGQGFEVGQTFAITGQDGSQSTIKVKSVDPATGAIKAVELISFGYEFNVDFNLLIAPNGDPANPTATISLNTPSTSLTYPSTDRAVLYQESGEIVRHNYTNTGQYMLPTYVGELVGVILPTIGYSSSPDQVASIRVKSVCVHQYPGYYINSASILGDLTYVQDSRYYQVFSYVTEVEDEITKYGEILKATLHPTGTRHFGTYKALNSFLLSPQFQTDIDFINKSKPLADFMYFKSSTDDLTFSLTMNLTNDPSGRGDNFRMVEAVRFNVGRTMVPEVATVTDLVQIVPTKNATDITVVTDQITDFDFTKGPSDIARILDQALFEMTKYTADTARVTGTGWIITSLNYVEVGTQYWLPGYGQAEYAITN